MCDYPLHFDLKLNYRCYCIWKYNFKYGIYSQMWSSESTLLMLNQSVSSFQVHSMCGSVLTSHIWVLWQKKKQSMKAVTFLSSSFMYLFILLKIKK